MAIVTFFGKSGCTGNRGQMETLKASGHEVVFRDLLSEPWTAATLTPFLEGLLVAGWFNRSTKRVKAGEVDPDRLDSETALALLLADPLLIRRPLLEVGGVRAAGWDTERLAAWIGLAADRDPGSEGCARGEHEHHHGQV